MNARTWFITGAASGFGYHLTTQLVSRGDRVIATDLRPGPLAVLGERDPDQLSVTTLDITDAAATRTVTADAFAAAGRLDGIGSNASFGGLGAAEGLSDQILHRQ